MVRPKDGSESVAFAAVFPGRPNGAGDFAWSTALAGRAIRIAITKPTRACRVFFKDMTSLVGIRALGTARYSFKQKTHGNAVGFNENSKFARG